MPSASATLARAENSSRPCDADSEHHACPSPRVAGRGVPPPNRAGRGAQAGLVPPSENCNNEGTTADDKGAPMRAETIARALGGFMVGQGWMACCPVHDDRRPSLSISRAGTARCSSDAMPDASSAT